MSFSRKRNLVFAAIFATIAGMTAFFYIEGVAKKRAVATGRVVVALRDIPQGESIGKDAVAVREAGDTPMGRHALSEISEAVNKTASSSIYEGEPVLSTHLSSVDRGGEAAYLISEAKMAIAVPADPVSAVGYGIRPGDAVDIFVTTDKSLNGQDETRLLYEDVRVIGLGGTYPFGQSKEGIIGADPQPGGGSIIVEVSQEQAKAITYFSEKAKLKFALRSKEAAE